MSIALAIICLSLIALTPIFYEMARVLGCYVYYRYFADSDIYVTYKENGTIVSRFKMSFENDGSVITTPLHEKDVNDDDHRI